MHNLLSVAVVNETYGIYSQRTTAVDACTVVESVVSNHQLVAALNKRMVTCAGQKAAPCAVGSDDLTAFAGLQLCVVAKGTCRDCLTNLIHFLRVGVHRKCHVVGAVFVVHIRSFVDACACLTTFVDGNFVFRRRVVQVGQFLQRRVVGGQPVNHFHAEDCLPVPYACAVVAVAAVIQVLFAADRVNKRVNVDCIGTRNGLVRNFAVGCGEVIRRVRILGVVGYKRSVGAVRVHHVDVLLRYGRVAVVADDLVRVEEHKVQVLFCVVPYFGCPVVGVVPRGVEVRLIGNTLVFPVGKVAAAPALNTVAVYKVACAVCVKPACFLAVVDVNHIGVGNLEVELVEVVQIFVVFRTAAHVFVGDVGKRAFCLLRLLFGRSACNWQYHCRHQHRCQQQVDKFFHSILRYG